MPSGSAAVQEEVHGIGWASHALFYLLPLFLIFVAPGLFPIHGFTAGVFFFATFGSLGSSCYALFRTALTANAAV